jgi:hypothetical protein
LVATTTAAAPIAAPTATAVATAIAAGGSGSATTTATTAGFGLIDAKGATHKFCALEGLNGALLGGVIGHFHKGKAPFATGVPLQGEGTVAHFAKGGEQFNDVLLFRTEGEVADKNAHWP